MKNISLSLCLCGCGQKVSNEKSKYLSYHWIRLNNPMKSKEVSEKVRLKNIGRVKTKEEIEKIKKSCIGINRGDKNGMYGRNGPLHHNFGKQQSEETKIRNSESHKGKIPWNLNKPLSKEVKDKISKSNTGKIRSEEFKKQKSIRMKGDKHPNWLGGCTKEGYCEQWRTKDLKEYILFRDNNNCQNPQCNKISIKLSIHHINYNKKDCNPKNLITLCFSCNSIANFEREWWECFYKEIIRRKGIY
jgi:hypothetical protein